LKFIFALYFGFEDENDDEDDYDFVAEIKKPARFERALC